MGEERERERERGWFDMRFTCTQRESRLLVAESCSLDRIGFLGFRWKKRRKKRFCVGFCEIYW